MADRRRDGALGGDDVAAGEDARAAGHQVLADVHEPVLDLDALGALEQRQVGVLAEREHERVGLELLELAGRLREAGLVELHLLEQQAAAVGVADRGEPLDDDALGERLLELGVVGGHPVARAPVDDHGLLGAEALRGACGVERGVAAAVDGDAAAELRRLLALHAAQQRDRVEHPRGAAGRDVGALAEVGADGDEGGVERAVAHHAGEVVDAAVADAA